MIDRQIKFAFTATATTRCRNESASTGASRTPTLDHPESPLFAEESSSFIDCPTINTLWRYWSAPMSIWWMDRKAPPSRRSFHASQVRACAHPHMKELIETLIFFRINMLDIVPVPHLLNDLGASPMFYYTPSIDGQSHRPPSSSSSSSSLS